MTTALQVVTATGDITGLFDTGQGDVLPQSLPSGTQLVTVSQGLHDAMAAERVLVTKSVIWDVQASLVRVRPPPPPSTQQVVAQRLAAVQAALAQHLALGVSYQAAGQSTPSVFAVDDASQARLNRASALVDKGKWPANGVWPTAAGVPIPFAAADVTALAEKAGVYVAACDINAVALGAEIGAGQNPDITQGWPANS